LKFGRRKATKYCKSSRSSAQGVYSFASQRQTADACRRKANFEPTDVSQMKAWLCVVVYDNTNADQGTQRKYIGCSKSGL